MWLLHMLYAIGFGYKMHSFVSQLFLFCFDLFCLLSIHTKSTILECIDTTSINSFLYWCLYQSLVSSFPVHDPHWGPWFRGQYLRHSPNSTACNECWSSLSQPGQIHTHLLRSLNCSAGQFGVKPIAHNETPKMQKPITTSYSAWAGFLWCTANDGDTVSSKSMKKLFSLMLHVNVY